MTEQEAAASAAMDCDEAAAQRSETVVFNVGGRTFEVLREPTLAMCPNSLLSQLAEDWDSQTPIFVEANPELFHYLLDFHRHRKVHIPFTVSKEALLLEARALNLPLEQEHVIQEVQLHEASRQLEQLLADARRDVEAELKASRINTLRTLVLKLALKKMRGALELTVSSADIAQMEGTPEKRCSFSGRAHRTHQCPPTESEEDVNAFEAVMQFLCEDVTNVDLQRSLQSWADKQGFKIEVRGNLDKRWAVGNHGKAIYHRPNFSCHFS
mmetsp:Transcript_31720/g.73610  ORF Transcript_31720/g.73610 Transcript_31720/m.73610 type:complete len:269 (+) Transcript_31720:64-870(+)